MYIVAATATAAAAARLAYIALVAVAAQIKNVQMSGAITQMSMHLFNLKCACGSTFSSSCCFSYCKV